MLINAEAFACSTASLQDIRTAIANFKESGKFVVAYSGAYTQGAYYVSSVADKVFLNPSGSISWHGLSAQTMFLKDLLAKVGVKSRYIQISRRTVHRYRNESCQQRADPCFHSVNLERNSKRSIRIKKHLSRKTE